MKLNEDSSNIDFSVDTMKKHAVDIILPYWEKYSRDMKNGGFYGSIDNDNNQDVEISRSIVMTSRFLWAYSAAARTLDDSSYLDMASFAYDTILNNFLDSKNGGVFWSVKPSGLVDVSKKQIYGQAFAIYGLSEYAAAMMDLKNNSEKATEAMNLSLDLYFLLEKYALEKDFGGYVEACAENWDETSDLKLSEKDIDCCKSMNTNLHVMEAFTNLHKTLKVVFPEKNELKNKIAKSLSDLVKITVKYILQDKHLNLYFDKDWTSLNNIISFGHDIEASWLLQEAVEELADKKLEEAIRKDILKLVDSTFDEGLDSENLGLCNEFVHDKLDENRIWWVQAEGVTGFYNAYQMTGNEKYLLAAKNIWKWICENQVDYKNGDWFAVVSKEGNPILTEDKGGNWKTAYHNVRLCLEMIRRLSNK